MRGILFFLAFCFLSLAVVSPSVGADATSFDPTLVAVKAKGSGGVPVGMILAWPVGQNPEDMDNWLECNGQSVSQSAYPELFAVVGNQVPDLRGLFLRGHGGNSAGLGIRQGDATRGITGKVIGLQDGGATGAFYISRTFNPGFGHYSGGWTNIGEATLDTSRIVPTADEIRPENQAVRYLIRARP